MPDVKTRLSFAVTALLVRPAKKGENHKKSKVVLLGFVSRKNNLLVLMLQFYEGEDRRAVQGQPQTSAPVYFMFWTLGLYLNC